MSFVLPGLLATAWLAQAATYYVATNGSDSNAGTSSAPFFSLQAGVNIAKPGDTIIVQDGTYGPNGAGIDSMPVWISTAGTASAPITLKAANKWGAVLDCQLTCHSYINLANGAAYWIIQDFDIENGYFGGVWANSSASNFTLRGNHIHNIGNRIETSSLGICGFYSGSLTHDMVFDGNEFNDIGRTGGLPNPNHDQGIYSDGTNGTVVNNIFYDMTKGWGVQLIDGATNWLIANNTFAFPNPGESGQIVLYGGNNGGSVTVNNTTIRNNIFYQPSTYAIFTNTSVPLNGCTIDHNLVIGASNLIDQPQNCTIGTNQIGVNPLLANVSTAPFDFHLTTGSPAIDAGATVSSASVDFDRNSRPQGSAYDIGAYEFITAGTTIPAPTISGLFSSSVTPNSAAINWSTDQASSSYVQYGTSTSYSNSTTLDPTLVTIHSSSLSSLAASTLYHYRVQSTNSAGLTSVSPDATFTTGAPPPVVTSFSMAASLSQLSAVQGSSSQVTTITATLTSGTPGVVSFSTSALPSGVTASFSTGSCSPSCGTTLTFSSSSSTPVGSYTITINGNGSSASASTSVTLAVSAAISSGSADIKSGLVAEWKFNEGQGSIAGDSSGNGNTGTLQNANWSNGTFGTDVSLNGSTGDVSVKESASLEMSNQLTVSFWTFTGGNSGTDPQPRIITKVSDWDIKLNGTSRHPQLEAAGKWAAVNYSIPTNTWVHVAITFSTGTVKAYINGTPVGFYENTFTGTEVLPTAANGLLIGTDGSNFYSGNLDDVRVYNRALSDADVSLLYTGTLQPVGSTTTQRRKH